MKPKYLIVSWHQNNQKINGILSGLGKEEVFFFFFFFFQYSYLAAKYNSDSGGKQYKAQRHNQYYQLFYTITILTVKYMFWSIIK